MRTGTQVWLTTVSKYQDAATAWQHQLAIARKKQFPSNSDLGWIQSNVALALAGAGDLSGARENWEQARNILEAAHQQRPDDPDVSDKLGRVLTAYAKLLRRTGDATKAEALEKEAESLNH
jgi:tetratricopeptide (TPR) repeat protein